MNVTPLVDVVLVLLIIFMIVIPAMEEGLDLVVPAVRNPDEQAEDGPDPFMLAITASGDVYLQERPIRREALGEALQTLHAREPRRRLVLRGDRGIGYGRVRSLFAQAQRVGFPGVSLRVNHQTADDETSPGQD